jgi:hypothetical protein
MHRIPRTVILPSALTIDSQHLRIALNNPSRQLLHRWRLARNFPQSHRDGKKSFCIVAEVETWLIAQGVRVRKV